MKKSLLIGLQSSDWYNEMDHEASMKYASEIGFETIEFNIDSIIDVQEYLNGKKFPICDKPVEEFVEYYKPLKMAAEKYNINIGQMHAPFPIWCENNKQATEYLLSIVEKICAVCAYLGCSKLIVHPYYARNEQELLRINFEMYERLIPVAKKCSVEICLENLITMNGDEIVGGVCSSPEQAVYLIDKLNEKAGKKLFGFCFDIGHANAAGVEIRNFLNVLGERITALHIHDNNGKSDAHLIPYTQIRDQWGLELGIDWEAFIEGLKDINYSDCIMFESFRAINNLPKAVEKEALTLLFGLGKYFRERIQ